MSLTLSLQKPGQVAPKPLTLSLNKGARFSAELFWDSKHDLDTHALLATNSGQGAKINDLTQVLSTYNCLKTNKDGALAMNRDGKSFSTPCGSLTHSGDARDGTLIDVDEIITIDGSNVPPGVNEIPIFVTIHPDGSANFSEVKQAGIRFKNDSGKELASYVLSTEFAGFNAVQLGSLLLGTNGWEFSPVGSGFNGDFNMVLGHFT